VNQTHFRLQNIGIEIVCNQWFLFALVYSFWSCNFS